MSKNEIVKTEDLKDLTAEQLAEFAIKCAESVLDPKAAYYFACKKALDAVNDSSVRRNVTKAKELASKASATQNLVAECRLRAAQWAALTAAGAKTYPDIARTRDCALTASQFALRSTMEPRAVDSPLKGGIDANGVTATKAEIAKQWEILENIKSK